jgi:hypothetical protein
MLLQWLGQTYFGGIAEGNEVESVKHVEDGSKIDASDLPLVKYYTLRVGKQHQTACDVPRDDIAARYLVLICPYGRVLAYALPPRKHAESIFSYLIPRHVRYRLRAVRTATCSSGTRDFAETAAAGPRERCGFLSKSRLELKRSELHFVCIACGIENPPKRLLS